MGWIDRARKVFHARSVGDDIEFDLDFDKAASALLCMATKTPKFDQYKACKLLFLADKRHLVKYGQTITGDCYAAVKYGPIPSNIRNEIKNLVDNNAGRLKGVLAVDRAYEHPRLIANQPIDETVLSESDAEVLNEIVEEFGPKSFNELKAITHEMEAFKRAWKPEEGKSFPMRFVDFFEEDEDALAGVREEVIENYALKKSFA